METFYYLCRVKQRTILYYKNYFKDFFASLDEGTRTKVVYVMTYVKEAERWSPKFVKHIDKGLFEMRIEWESNIYRVFFILDGRDIVVLFNGFQKKTQKTPLTEIRKAQQIMKEYYEGK